MAIAVVATGFGGPEVLSLVEVPVGKPGPGQVLIEVRAAGVNPIDYKRYQGRYGATADQFPIRLGFEAAGVVRAVGEGAEGPGGPLHTGDAVIAYPVQGAYASELVAPAANVLAKPTGLSFEQASGLMLTGVTAVHALRATSVGVGDTVLVHGASGGVGLMVVQLAVNARARVIGTASEANHALLRQLGAEPVSYGNGLMERVQALAPEGVDAAIDAVGTDEAVYTSLALVADRNRIATVVSFKRGLEEGIKVLGQGPGADPGAEVRGAARVELVRLAEKGRLTVFIAAAYPLSDVVAAHVAIGRGHSRGKIVLLP
jgi:NADPH:quinone reductase-like Zn-dependent oxidoreductase